MLEAKIGDSVFELSPKEKGIEVNGEYCSVSLVEQNGNQFHFMVNNKKVIIESEGVHFSKTVILWLNGRKYSVELKDELGRLLDKMGMNNISTQAVKEIKAPMPGLVLKILVKEGDTVEKDDSLVILEAMKMENVIKSPGSGIVKTVKATQGKAVEKNDLLILFE